MSSLLELVFLGYGLATLAHLALSPEARARMGRGLATNVVAAIGMVLIGAHGVGDPGPAGWLLLVGSGACFLRVLFLQLSRLFGPSTRRIDS